MIPYIQPMEPIITNNLPKEDGYVYQVKWDGVRILSYIQQGQIQLYTRNGNERTHTYPEIVSELTRLFSNQAVLLDGEMVALKENRPDFYEVLKRDRLRSGIKIQQATERTPVYYVIFDCLHYGQSLLNQPLHYRLNIINQFAIQSEFIQICPTTTEGETLYHFTKKHELEGVVIKEEGGLYYPGQKHPIWKKLKHFQQVDATILGFVYKERQIRSLILGIHENNKWRYIGRAYSGLNQEQVIELEKWGQTNTINKIISTFPDKVSPIVWIKPLLSVRVRFMQWTPDGTMRSPVILGFMIQKGGE